MKSEHAVCVICSQEIEDKVVKFTATTLDKSKSILKIRKEHDLKYNDISLPEEVNANTGYHVKCYKNFLAVMRKYRYNEPSTSSNLPKSSSGLACKEKWKNIRSAYTRYLRQKSPKKKEYYLAEHLEFLLPFTKTKAQRKVLQSVHDPNENDNGGSDKDSDTDYTDVQSLCKIEENYENLTATSYDDPLPNTSSQNASSDTKEFKRKRKEMDPLELGSGEYHNPKRKEAESPDSEDADLHFLKSLLPDLRKMTSYQKYEFKCKTMQLIGEILYNSSETTKFSHSNGE